MRRVRSYGWSGLVLALLVTGALAAIDFPRGTLWRVEQTCVLNSRTTGSPFPCLAVDLAKGFAVLRAPFRQTHVVLMPTERITGIEDPRLRGPIGSIIFAEAWNAREFVEAEVQRRLAFTDIGLAVNSAYTRSQDQLHIHVDCLRTRVKADVQARQAGFPKDAWMPDGYRFKDQTYFARRLDKPDLAGTSIASLIDEIPALRAHPDRTTLAILGTADATGGGTGYVLLAAETTPAAGAGQWTSEDLLDHQCRPSR